MQVIDKEYSPARPPITWVPSLYFAQGLPFAVVNYMLTVTYKNMGIGNDVITRWTGIIGLVWGFKWLWSPFLELAPRKKTVVVLTQMLGGVGLAATALTLQLPAFFTLSISIIAVVSIISATHDIASDGLYIIALDPKRRAEYTGWQGAFFNVAKLVAVGGLLTLAGRLEGSIGVASAWTVIFGVMAAMMIALSIYHSWSLPATRSAVSPEASIGSVFHTLKDVVVEFFRKPGIWFALAFVVVLRAGEGLTQAVAPLFLRDSRALGGLGLSTEQIGIIYGSAGTVSLVAGCLLGGYFASWLGLKRALLWLILALNVQSAVFLFLSIVQPTSFAVIGSAVGLENLTWGFGSTAVLVFLFQTVSEGKYQTAHYAVGSGFMGLGFSMFKIVSGDMQLALGYKHFFMLSLLCAIPAILMSRFLRLRGNEDSVPDETAA